jgi:hypothetical protein
VGNGRRSALRKLKGEKEAAEAKKRPVGKEETPAEFAEKMKGIHKEVEGVRNQVVKMTEHQNDIRNAILAIRRESTASKGATPGFGPLFVASFAHSLTRSLDDSGSVP